MNTPVQLKQVKAETDYDLIYNYEQGLKAYSEILPVLIMPNKDAVDACMDWGLPAICLEAGKWTREHSELVKGWELAFSFGPKEWRQRIAKAVEHYAQECFLIDVSTYEDIGAYIRAGKSGDALYEKAFTAPVYDYRDEQANDANRITATPYEWTEPEKLPRRQWLMGRSVQRKYVTVVVAPPGAGKSKLVSAEAIAMATGKNLFDVWVKPLLRVWLNNGEDDRLEMTRMIQAICKRHGIGPKELEGRFFLDSGRDQEIVTATMTRNGVEILEPVYESITRAILERHIDVFIVDPFVSSHRVSENDNMAIDAVVKRWNKVAEDCNCAIILVHHSRKENGGEITADSCRGGSSIVGAARDVRVINRMTKEQAESYGLDDYRRYFNVGSDKTNFTPAGRKEWYHLESVNLCNDLSRAGGDSVGVCVRWYPPNPVSDMTRQQVHQALERIAKGDCRYNPQAKKWAGNLLAELFGYDTSERDGKRAMKEVLGALERDELVKRVEKTCPESREKKPFYEAVR